MPGLSPCHERRLVEAHPAVASFQSELAANYGVTGLVLHEMGRATEALEAHEAAIALQRRQVEARPTPLGLRLAWIDRTSCASPAAAAWLWVTPPTGPMKSPASSVHWHRERLSLVSELHLGASQF